MTVETPGRVMNQVAPYPEVLERLVDNCQYRPGWTVALVDRDRGQGSKGLTLIITTTGYNSYHCPELGPNEFGPGEGTVCSTCHEPFPCRAYRRWDSDEAPRGPYRVAHYMPVPPAAYDERSWRRWLFEQFLLVERHEACEFFRFEYETPNQVGIETLGTVRHGDRPYAPHHGPGNDPYIVFEHGSDLDVRTSFRGEVKE